LPSNPWTKRMVKTDRSVEHWKREEGSITTGTKKVGVSLTAKKGGKYTYIKKEVGKRAFPKDFTGDLLDHRGKKGVVAKRSRQYTLGKKETPIRNLKQRGSITGSGSHERPTSIGKKQIFNPGGFSPDPKLISFVKTAMVWGTEAVFQVGEIGVSSFKRKGTGRMSHLR